MTETRAPKPDLEWLPAALDAAEAAPDAVALRARDHALLRLVAGATVIDVGCGTGRAVADLGRLGARALGVDLDAGMLAAARARHPGIAVCSADATALPLADGEARGYRADKVFHTLPEPLAALTEARRVLAPGGRIVLVGQDWDTMVIDSDRPALTRRIVHARADTIPQPRSARAYRNLLLDTGFHEVSLEVHTLIFTEATTRPLLDGHATAAHEAGAITATEAEEWMREQAIRATTGRLLIAVPMFLASATR
ncbi:methyltransferase domain-containing protein [Actinoplanes sp. G11-F43]|uniref:methyltransferase domain-containing protein n=1 Tax=Actinoplanes sp. G11-F43 TaxID=3424130 RepID=UPI003D32E124